MAVQNFLKEMEVRVERLQSIPAVYVHSCGLGSDQDAAKRIMEWASINGLIGRKEVRLFGRTTYPVDKSKPHGYECYLTVGDFKNESVDVEVREMPSGLYAVLRFKDPRNLDFAWKKLWNWIEESGHEYAGWRKEEHGWVNGFEEHVNWQEQQRPPTEWIFDLWVQLKE